MMMSSIIHGGAKLARFSVLRRVSRKTFVTCTLARPPPRHHPMMPQYTCSAPSASDDKDLPRVPRNNPAAKVQPNFARDAFEAEDEAGTGADFSPAALDQWREWCSDTERFEDEAHGMMPIPLEAAQEADLIDMQDALSTSMRATPVTWSDWTSGYRSEGETENAQDTASSYMEDESLLELELGLGLELERGVGAGVFNRQRGVAPDVNTCDSSHKRGERRLSARRRRLLREAACQPGAQGAQELHCHGCGVRLQSETPEVIGYVPRDVLARVVMSPEGPPGGRVGNARGSSGIDTDTSTDAKSAQALTQRPNVRGKSVLGHRQLDSALCQRCHSLRFHNREHADHDVAPSGATATAARAGARVQVGGDGRGDRGGMTSTQFAGLLEPLGAWREAAPAAGEDKEWRRRRMQAKDAPEPRRVVVLVVADATDFRGSFVRGLARFVGKAPTVLALNKVDLLPDGASETRLRHWGFAEVRATAVVEAEAEAMAAAGEFRALDDLDGHEPFDVGGTGADTDVDVFEDFDVDLNDDVALDNAAQRRRLRLRAVCPISALSGRGVRALLREIATVAASARTEEVLVVGAANAGKSTLLNRLIRGGGGGGGGHHTRRRGRGGGRSRSGSRSDDAITTSALPGTTLGLLRVRLRVPPSRHAATGASGRVEANALTLLDTPGLLPPAPVASPGTQLGFDDGESCATGAGNGAEFAPYLPNGFASLLTSAELAAVAPSRRLEPATVRLKEGGALLLGGLAVVTLAKGRPFFATAFVSSAVDLHCRRSAGVLEFIARHGHADGLLTPPLTPPPLTPPPADADVSHVTDANTIADACTGMPEHVSPRPSGCELWPFVAHEFHIVGRGWREAAADIVLPGLGWVAITGAGDCRVVVHVPASVQVELRERCLMPYEAHQKGAARFTGSVLVGRGHSRRPRAEGHEKKAKTQSPGNTKTKKNRNKDKRKQKQKQRHKSKSKSKSKNNQEA